MKIGLVCAPFRNGKTEENVKTILKYVNNCAANGCDMAVFGEAVLQGFDALTWDYDSDINIAVEENSAVIRRIRDDAKAVSMAVGFGYIEKENGIIYSSFLVIGRDGSTVCNFRRVSKGWKEAEADVRYCEGEAFPVFEWEGKRFTVGLCGDLWYDENIAQIAALDADAVLWPVYVDYDPDEWERTAKAEYAEQAARTGKHVLFVNPVCADENRKDAPFAVGGAAHFFEGKVVCEWPMGKAGIMIAE